MLWFSPSTQLGARTGTWLINRCAIYWWKALPKIQGILSLSWNQRKKKKRFFHLRRLTHRVATSQSPLDNGAYCTTIYLQLKARNTPIQSRCLLAPARTHKSPCPRKAVAMCTGKRDVCFQFALGRNPTPADSESRLTDQSEQRALAGAPRSGPRRGAGSQRHIKSGFANGRGSKYCPQIERFTALPAPRLVISLRCTSALSTFSLLGWSNWNGTKNFVNLFLKSPLLHNIDPS